MSDFLAEARVVVRPDTTRFRAELEAALSAATAKPIKVPVVPVVAGGLAAVTAETNAFTAAQVGAAAETQVVAASLERETIAATADTVALKRRNAELLLAARGAGSSALALLKVRGATLAASGEFLAGAAAVTLFAKAVQSAANLETELNVFKVTAGATADEMDRVSAAAKALGRDITLPGVTAGQAATAMTELAKAGLSVEDSLSGARGALQLATAAQIDVKDATTLVAGALNAFQLSGTEAVRVADLLTGAAKESQGEITDFGTSLGQAAAVSKQFGVGIEDTITLLTELAQAGISGGRAGTSLRVAFLRLVNPPAAAAKALAELNVQLRDSFGNLRPQIFTDIAEAMQGYTKAQQDATLATIFGSDAIRAAGIIGAQGALHFDTLKQSVTEAGLAQKQAAARTQGLQGDFLNLSNQVSDLGLKIGEAASGPMSLFVTKLTDIVSGFNAAIDGSVKLAKSFKDLGKSADETVPGLGLIDRHLKQIGKAATELNPAILPFAALARAGKLAGDNLGDASKKTDEYGNSVDSVAESVSTLNVLLLQSAADSKINTQAVSSATAALLVSAADSRIGINKILNEPAPPFGVKQIENIIGGFDAEAVRAKISGDNKALIAILEEEQAFLQKQLQRVGVKNRPALRREIENALLGTINDISAIQAKASSAAEKQKADAEKAASDAAAAVRAREQALLSSQGLARDQRKNIISRAAQTQGLQDDIVQEKKLKALVVQQIAQVRERISVEGGRAAAIAALRAILNQINAELSSLAQQQQDAQQAQRDALLQGISLDVELAQITNNQLAEVNARNKKIGVLEQALRREAKLHGKTTVAYKEIRNQIAAERAAIEAITKEKQKSNQSFAQASFEFLQAQQGFASTLLGNLIPRGATGGLVGGSQTPVQGALQPVAGAAEARSQSGVTSGQGNATNHLLQQILAQLKELNGETKAPEATKQRANQWSVMDGVGGG